MTVLRCLFLCRREKKRGCAHSKQLVSPLAQQETCYLYGHESHDLTPKSVQVLQPIGIHI